MMVVVLIQPGQNYHVPLLPSVTLPVRQDLRKIVTASVKMHLVDVETIIMNVPVRTVSNAEKER
jgi:hypothetical protein